MNKLLSLITALLLFFTAIGANTSETKSKPEKLDLVIKTTNNRGHVHRSPLLIDIEAFYYPASGSIEIIYDGEADGNVYIYCDDNLIGYDSSLNTSFSIPHIPGYYKIEIISESWSAVGYIQL